MISANIIGVNSAIRSFQIHIVLSVRVWNIHTKITRNFAICAVVHVQAFAHWLSCAVKQ